MLKSRGILLTILLVCAQPAYSQPEVSAAVIDFFRAMSAGDIRKIEGAIADPLRSRVRTLLEKNATYPDILVRRYGGATIEIIESTPLSGQRYYVKVDVIDRDRQRSKMKLILTEDSEGNWFVADQIFD